MVYEQFDEKVAALRAQFGRPLTYAEKVLAAHTDTLPPGELAGTYVDFRPDRVALQDALAQIVVLQFMVAGLDETVVPTTVHCDHLIRAHESAAPDLRGALDENREVYEFLRSASARFGMGFWPPGSGIIHQVVLENYAFPGGMMIGTDSHTPNAGGLGMVAVGVGGGDAIDVMTGAPFNLAWPRRIGVRLEGTLSGWSAPKDVILDVVGRLSVRGGTGAIIEYLGPGARTISATGKATICNMGAETGATTSIFPYDAHTAAYLRATGRHDIAALADRLATSLQADAEVEADPVRFFDELIEIDLSSLAPSINGPGSPDLTHRLDEVGAWAASHDIPVEISAALIGSCTNSSYEDIGRAASVSRAAAHAGLRAQVPLYVTPGSEHVRATLERDGLLADLERIGAVVLANACGPCIGQWDRPATDASTPNTIVTSFNRNFPRRNDGSASTSAFLASPEVVVALAVAGTLEVDPTRELVAPEGDVLPPRGFARSRVEPAVDRRTVDVVVSSTSERLQMLRPFPAWDGSDFVDLPVLVKAKGKCTTDDISPAGAWLRYRGHLDRMSDNLFLGVVNAFRDVERGHGRDPLDGAIRPLPEIARRLQADGVRWCAVGDDNYGEGSSREHAAMEPRHRGGVVIFARSFARIHETNLKKQGVLPLTFAERETYDLVGEDDRLSVLGLADVAPDSVARCRLSKPDGTTIDFAAVHTLTPRQIEWFRAGSALNVIRGAAAAT